MQILLDYDLKDQLQGARTIGMITLIQDGILDRINPTTERLTLI